MFCYFIIYEQDGRTGNDFIAGNIPPYKWLVDARKKYPKTSISIKSFSREQMPEHQFNQYSKQIGIEQDNAQLIKIKADNKAKAEQPVVKPVPQEESSVEQEKPLAEPKVEPLQKEKPKVKPNANIIKPSKVVKQKHSFANKR